MNTIKKAINKVISITNRVIIFFDLWGKSHYDNYIDADLAWTMAGIFSESDALDGFEAVK